MIKPRYIKMFEAFEAEKLTKTLSHVGKNSMDKFIGELSRVAETIDLPMSKFSDKYFKYLPFNKALSLNISGDKCTATSLEEFKEFGVEGESCVDGKMKRKWGTRTRQVICPECLGTSIKKSEGEIGLIKFWFNRNSEYLGATMVDGIIRNPISSKTRLVLPDLSNYIETSQNLDDYIVLQKMTSIDEIRECPHLSFLNTRIGDVDFIGRLWIEDDSLFILQDFVEGSSPTSEEWKKYAKFSSGIRAIRGNTYTLLPKSLNIDIPEDVDPYTWNAPFTYGYNNIRYTNSILLRSILDNASYALILDYKGISGSDYTRKSEITSDRSDSVKDAQFLLSDDEIRKTNFKRYVNSLNYDITKDLSNVKFTMFRILGFKYFGIHLINTYNSDSIREAIGYVYEIIKNNENTDGYYSRYLKNTVRQCYTDSVNRNMSITHNIKEFLKSNSEYKDVVYKILELNQAIYDKFYNIKIDTFEDLEVFHMKMKSVSDTFRNQNRYETYNFRKVIYNLGDSYGFNSYIESANDENFREAVDYFIKVINKL